MKGVTDSDGGDTAAPLLPSLRGAHQRDKEARGQQGELIAMDRLKARRREWLWEQRIPLGALTLLTGKKGAGKSSLVSEIAEPEDSRPLRY